MRHVLGLLGVLLVLVLVPSTADAAVCADYPNQAAAQRAADTRDTDGDGIYCENLPCPCSYATGSGGSSKGSGGGSKPPAPTVKRLTARVSSIGDGDTLVVKTTSGRFERVQLLGIDAPDEDACGGREAIAYLLTLAFTAPKDTDGDGLVDARGGTARLVRVRTDPNQRVRDDRGRLQAYVTTVSKPKSLGLELLRAGWATRRSVRGTFAERTRFNKARDTARKAGRGAWGACGGKF